MMVRLFNEGLVPVLVCTSTLIEGVNTAAKNVVIFEKKIDNQLIDFFTFSNIRGRAGRMLRHYVGKVYTYMPQPVEHETLVDIPIESQSDKATDADLIQVDDDRLIPASRDRISDILDQRDLSVAVIRRNRGIDPSLQIEAARRLRTMPRTEALKLSWTGSPRAENVKATLTFAFENLLEPSARRGINAKMLWGMIQNMRVNAGDMIAQLDQQMTYARQGQTRSDVLTGLLRFQRNWMGFTIPSMLRTLQAIQGEVLGSGRGFPRANYEYLLREIESHYLRNGVTELEEYGLPIPLTLRLFELGLEGNDLPELLEGVVALASDATAVSQLSAIEQWILDDVIAGLIGPAH